METEELIELYCEEKLKNFKELMNYRLSGEDLKVEYIDSFGDYEDVVFYLLDYITFVYNLAAINSIDITKRKRK